MSRPYQFADADKSVPSPLDRKPPTTIPSNQAPSFKTDMNRNKTRKWVEAKQVSYGGDDWGSEEDDDEIQQADPLVVQANRTPSFSLGDENKIFSAGQHKLQSSAQEDQRATSGTSNAQTEVSDISAIHPEKRRDFSPTAMVAPLQTSLPPSTQPDVGSPTSAVYNPRSNISTSSNKALPFIRPAEIYKRMEEAREQEHRPSNESSRSGELYPAPTQKSGVDNYSDDAKALGKSSLSNIPERQAGYNPPAPSASHITQFTHSSVSNPQADRKSFNLPKLDKDSSFGDDFWSKDTSTTLSVPTSSEGPIRKMVQKAFNPPDSSGLSKQDSLRSHATSGTSDISPILNPLYEAESASTNQEYTNLIYSAATPQYDAHDFKDQILPPPPLKTNSRPHSKDGAMFGSPQSSRAESPSKSRVKTLSNQFEDLDSKRSSVVSSGPEVRKAESPTPHVAEFVNADEPITISQTNPRPHVQASFDSYNQHDSPSELPTPAPNPQPMKNIVDKALVQEPIHELPETPELEPTTERHQLKAKDHTLGPLAVAAAGGAALGAAIRNSLTKTDDLKDSPTSRDGPTKDSNAALASTDNEEPSNLLAKGESKSAVPSVDSNMVGVTRRFSWESSGTPLGAASQVEANEGSRTPDNAKLTGEGLHVINTQTPVTTSPNIISPYSPISHLPNTKPPTIVTSSDAPTSPHAQYVSAGETRSNSQVHPQYISDDHPQFKNKEFPSFREIQLIKSTDERIQAYSDVRHQWAALESGLSEWMNKMISSNPEHETLRNQAKIALPNFAVEQNNLTSNNMNNPETPPKDRRTSAGPAASAAAGAAGKKAIEGLKGLGGKGKGFLKQINQRRLRGNEGVGN